MKKKIIHKSVTINAKPQSVFNAFTDPNQLTAWLHAHSAVIALCKNGPYTIGWCANNDGNYYACCGRIQNIRHNKSINISDTNYYFSNRKTIGPLTLTIQFEGTRRTTTVLLKQSGIGSGKKWEKNFEAVSNSWEEALYLLKKHIEKRK
jgi:uncharacterized protein YndB with AHSA1/START domain